MFFFREAVLINRIRDVRQLKAMTLADVAAACSPPTTAQTIGRLEMGTRTLSLDWMNRIARALNVEPEALLRQEGTPTPRLIATLRSDGLIPLPDPPEALLPHALAADCQWLVLNVEEPLGDYRTGDRIWLKRGNQGPFLNRDVLVSTRDGSLCFGRVFSHNHDQIGLLPLLQKQPPRFITAPEWVAVAEMLIRNL